MILLLKKLIPGGGDCPLAQCSWVVATAYGPDNNNHDISAHTMDTYQTFDELPLGISRLLISLYSSDIH